MKEIRWLKTCIFGLALLALTGCGSFKSDAEEVSQQAGDVMASMDESSGSNSGSGGFAAAQRALEVEALAAHQTFSRRMPAEVGQAWWQSLPLVPREASAATCAATSTFGACTSNVVSRTFGGCTIGTATLSGSVTLTWSDAATDSTCQMTASSHSVTRVPAFTITGPRGGTLTVSKTGTVGQKITRGTTAGNFSFTNDGIRRVIATGSGTTLFDFTTETTTAITITGTSRSDRVVSGGVLKVTDNVNSVSCDLVPTAVTWTSTCNCASSGTWAGTCSDGKTFSISISGCGTATATVGTTSTSVTFDRCYSTS